MSVFIGKTACVSPVSHAISRFLKDQQQYHTAVTMTNDCREVPVWRFPRASIRPRIFLIARTTRSSRKELAIGIRVSYARRCTSKHVQTIIALLLCVLLGVMVGTHGWLALLWLPLGFVIGVFVTAQIALPIMLGLPRAIRMVSRGAMRPGVYLRLVVTPFLWLVLLAAIFFLVGFFSPAAGAWLDGNAPLNVGTWVGIFAILLSPLSKKSRADFREDFDRSYAQFYTNLGASTESAQEA
jgi:hypothetical protein